MKVKLLYTDGKGSFEEIEWSKPAHKSDEIEVKALMTGVCRSDIEMMVGNFGPLPKEMQGHEGLGEVTQVGELIKNVKVGDIVATRGEPAYADYYNCRHNEFVVVPSADPKYILEPVACGIKCSKCNRWMLLKLESVLIKRCLILGSGFLAWIAYNSLERFGLTFETVDVVGSYNKHLWGDTLKQSYSGAYDVVIDLSSRTNILDDVAFNNEALLILGVQNN